MSCKRGKYPKKLASDCSPVEQSFSLKKIIWDAFPIYLAYGMAPDEYWRGNPYLAISYREAYKLKQEIKNNDAWLQGLYVYNAFSVVEYNLNKKKSQKAKDYLDKPIDLWKKPEPKTREEAIAAGIAELQALTMRWESTHGRSN